ncbi:kinesin [Laetiporus sulphureus 93-53]|uniref:Kinesin n=1 Tax=Laetiporus sulphureus 93-53 TaxID=1314785 RepID=A0A165G2V1_9APHY|nr:kinesin [Laetiporus sulphureus 93-53]KZT09755.1 kinesin [Laetiporus sulphureus 93-53]
MAPAPSPPNAATTSVQVALRIRPTTTQDTSSIPARFQRSVINAVSSTAISVDATPPSGSGATATAPAAGTSKKQVFTFDQVHPPSTTQHALFTSTAQPLVSRFIDGFNCTILAYGQTSSGKTFTMTGIDLDADPSDPSNGMGIIPRAVSTIFARCKEFKQERGDTWQCTLKGSFIEIYNEDLIDLLNMEEGAGKREVQIREDKQGHILWEGLREVNVRGPTEVMSLLRQGTAIRRTNETDMNAQSSRSHAIFSLTLSQKKFTGSKPPPRSSSPMPPGARPASRIARPGSAFVNTLQPRVSSPTFSRPATPSFQTAMSRTVRPASSLGLLTPDGGRAIRDASAEDGEGEWVTVVSKFHFVDLAGSERLKRTAAQGERIKEGISINSGLLALGNVISALGDPARAKSHTASYIPYRDSKLTRLLQDSLGGNAHTLMIACVSPAEWNVAETINTLKYANRARNIKNRVVVNEKEEGWDDLEWLQGTVMRLRRDLKGLKEGGGALNGSSGSTEIMEGAGKKVLAQMAELQNNYENLREKYVARTEELTRLRRELAEKQRNSKSGSGGIAKYEEIVGPVIEEYEKTIGAMEAELNLNRAALRHTNILFEEKEAEYADLQERHSTIELYVEELKARVAKLSEREASTEAYIHDLEEKIKHYDDSSITSSGSITDLKREITKYKDSETHSLQYIVDLEARLARADESVLALRETVETLENDCERRRQEAEALQSRLDNLMRDGQSWRNDLDERERKVHALELKMEEWEAKKKEAAEDRERLGDLVDEVAKERKHLEVSVPSLKSASSSDSLGIPKDYSVESQLVALQQTHTATLADLSSVTAKYRDALREIADLAAQLQEAKVNAPIAPSESPERPTDLSHRRRMTKGSSRDGIEPVMNGSVKRPFFRQAASAESLHTRSLSQSVSLSQELSSARSRKASISSHGTSSSISLSLSRPQSRLNLSVSLPSINVPSNERSVASLEKEIMRLQEVLQEREAEISALETSLKEKDRAAALASLSQTPSDAPTTPVNGLGSPELSLNLSPKTMAQFKQLRHSLHIQVSDTGSTLPDVDESLERLNELMRSMAQKESSHREAIDGLNTELSQVRRQYEELSVLSRDQTLNMSTELEALRNKHDEEVAKHSEDLQRLQQLEEHEVNLVDSLAKAQLHSSDLAESLENVQRREAELLASLERIQAEHASEIANLQAAHEEALRAKESEVDGLLARMKEEHEGAFSGLRDQLLEASAALEQARQEHEAAFGKLRADHEEELKRRSQAVEDMLESTRQDHEAALAKLAVEHQEAFKKKEEEAAATLSQTEEEYYDALTKLRTEHAQTLEKQSAEAATALERLRDEHAREMRMSEIAREGSLSESQSARDVALKELQEVHASAVSAKEQQFTDDIQKLKDEHAQTLAAKEEMHRSSRERLKASHAEAVNIKEATFADELAKLQADHSRTLSAKDDEHRAALEKSAAEHAATLSQLQEESQKEVARLTAELEQSRNELAASSSDLQKQLETELLAAKEQQASVLEEAQRCHADELLRLEEAHNAAVTAVKSEAEEQRSSLIKPHTEELTLLKAEHQAALAEAQANLIAVQDQHRQMLEEARAHSDQLLSEEKERISAALGELEKKHAEELEVIRRDHDLQLGEMQKERDDEVQGLQQNHTLLLEELESYKAASEEYVVAREETRRAHEEALQQKTDVIGLLHQQLNSSNEERDTLAAEVAKLRQELQETRDKTSELVKEASKRDSLVDELERHRSVIAEMQETLQRTKDEMDSLAAEKNRQDVLLRDLQSQLVRSPSPGQRQGFERSVRANGMSPTKLPPPAPPPTVPIPPAPSSAHETQLSIASSSAFTTPGSIDMPLGSPTTPATSIAPSMSGPPTSTGTPDPHLTAQIEQQAKQIEEQEAMIKTLNKQLMHCEGDLQVHMDLVTKLEGSLGEEEKNLRKARMQATELARERDNLNNQIAALRAELHEAKNEVVNVRRSIVEEKQSLEHRLDEERRAKERARAQLDSRMEELQKRKSKFACL